MPLAVIIPALKSGKAAALKAARRANQIAAIFLKSCVVKLFVVGDNAQLSKRVSAAVAETGAAPAVWCTAKCAAVKTLMRFGLLEAMALARVMFMLRRANVCAEEPKLAFPIVARVC